MLRTLSLFAGIGGFDLALEATGGFRTAAFCEINPFCQRVLRKHWTGIPIYDDIRTLTADALRRDGVAVDAIVGGFPCQDLSEAGEFAGFDGEQSALWADYARLIGELRPSLFIVENVSNLLSGPPDKPGAWFGRVLGDVAALGYDAEWHCIQAADIGAKHIRDRVWLVGFLADAASERRMQCWGEQLAQDSEAEREIRERFDQPEPPRVAHGIPDRMDRVSACGNAVVPPLVELIGRAVLASMESAE